MGQAGSHDQEVEEESVSPWEDIDMNQVTCTKKKKDYRKKMEINSGYTNKSCR